MLIHHVHQSSHHIAPALASLSFIKQQVQETDGECQDIGAKGGEWYDSGGAEFNCGWYRKYDQKACDTYGDSYKNFGLTANQVS